EAPYADLRNNGVLAKLFEENLRRLGVDPVEGIPWENAGSTDMGNVSHVVPALHPTLAIAPAEVPGHSQSFLEASGAPRGYQAMIDAAKALAMTGADLLSDPELVEQARREFRRSSGRFSETEPMINERYREDRERRRLGSLTVYSGPTHSGKTKKLEAEAERAQRQGRRLQRLASPSDPNALLNQLDPATELVTVDDAQQYDDRLVEVLNDLATVHRMDVVVAGWELDYAGRPAGPMPELLCAADFALKLDDGVCAQPGCRNLASRTQRFQVVNG